MSKLPTVEDVARAAGVSRQTVSNVLNSPGIVREATRKRVEQAIDELKYRPSAAARQLRTRRSSAIGVHLDPYSGGISGVLLDRFVHALTERASERGMRVCVYSARSPEEEMERLGALIDGGEIDAAVVTGTFFGDPRTGWLTQRNLPFVSFGRPWGGDDVFASAHSWVDVDGATGTAAATAWAIENAGPRVGWFGWPSDQGTGDDRRRGWQQAMAAAGSVGPTFEVADEVVAARQLMTAAFGQDGLGEQLDALVCVSDSLAVGAHLAAADAGRRDLTVIGFDNTPVAEALGLPSVEQSPELVAAGALDLLMGETGTMVAPLDSTTPAEHVLVAPRLVVREPALHR
ncbi:LacI family transcriptional regulator [Labedella gwakjiensis]|uniref:LacI family transcriptional regulator n=1 Tax=Labedella gwakjiensis TaxID=390269 RepID=A0A2P8GX55_9MICO|nr:LacI family DNA-binding transcriptional regulator [Labedella gwakjiensis]PSL38550.1 LacI family transcriptional regulator [Labedella gwakjiensis]RUQ86943.1 LacI family transcriptional regulator [Labedella gwakjiensis]